MDKPRNWKNYHVSQDYNVGKVIGRGAFSEVLECFHKTTGEKCAVKLFKKEDFKDVSVIFNEIDIIAQTQHDNVVRMRDVYDTHSDVYLVMDFVEGSDLFDVVCDHGGFCEETTRSIFRQILDAVRYLHNNGVVHRDLKLENILITSDFKPTLTDLGFAKKLDLSDSAFMRTRCGTPSYVAPEIVQCEAYTKAVDAWSLGVILYLLLFCEYPFYGETLDELYRQILSCEFSFPTQPRHEVSDSVKDLIRKLLKADPKERYTLDDAMSHPWLAKSTSGDPTTPETVFRVKAHTL